MRPVPKPAAKADALPELYKSVRAHTEELCSPLEIEDYIPQPTVDVSPPKWNIAHTTWFFEEMILKKFASGYEVFDPDFGFLFNSYYNTIGERTARDNRGDLSRPTVKRVFEFRKYVDEKMLELLAANDSDELRELVVLGCNHEQQHQELFLTDLKYTFSVNPLFPAYREGYATEELSEPPALAGGQFVDIKGGIFEIGYDGDGFCFDNELARHEVLLRDFSIADRLVTNAEFLEFINDGGYRRHELWHAEGLDWVNREQVNAPLYWNNIDGEWHYFTLGGLRKLPPEAPLCHVSFYEAAAFAEWKGMRLPTEFEWEAANANFDWGKRWEWTNSAYLPYPGFRKPGGAVGEYNGKFMINQMVLRGASVATPEGHSRPSYRNFFHPHLRWQFTGIRLAR
ncbi:MAG: ergothioneine biosynthesis protein EgtB [Acidobacteria bacterium]|nr:ergothioneine biosynthesis protein EgtB [Acidobacteriota bacterium]